MAEGATPITEERPHKGLSVAFGLAGVLIKLSLLGVAALATLIAVFGLMSSHNTMMASSNLKHERLRTLGSPKIVFVGGSNLSFGMDSSVVEEATGCPAVNMGINGFLGIRFLLSEVESEMHAGDIVVMAWEWDNYFKSPDGSAPDHLAVISENPALAAKLNPQQAVAVVALLPGATHARLNRVMSESIEAARVRLIGERPEPPPESIYTAVYEPRLPEDFSPQGDLLSHLNVQPPEQLMPSRIPNGTPIEQQALLDMQRFAQRMEARGVRVMVSYTPVLRSFYEERQTYLEEAHRRVQSMAPLTAPSPPSAYVFDRPEFFDTLYHLHSEGRVERAQRVAGDLQTQFGAEGLCARAQASAE